MGMDWRARSMANQSDWRQRRKRRGYHETGPLGGGTPAAPAPKASSLSGKLDLAFPAGWQTKPLTDLSDVPELPFWPRR